MAHQISHSLNVDLPVSKVWNVLNEYSELEKFAPTVKSSPLIGDIRTGVGARRRVTFHHDGSSLVEEITEYHEGRGFTMALTELSSPLKCMEAEFKLDGLDANSSSILMTVDFEVKGGPLGWLLAKFLIGPTMRGALRKTVAGLAYHTATGIPIDSELPSETELASAIGG